MNHSELIPELEKNKQVFDALLNGVSNAMRLWRPADDKWNLHEIVCHLLDEEIYDFRARVKHVLENPDKPMPPIDPQGWVKEKDYAAWDYAETLQRFLIERGDSLSYLKGLQNPYWKQVHQHPKLGEISAGSFLFNWLAHDYLHIRQVNRYQYQYLKVVSGIDLSYAGDW